MKRQVLIISSCPHLADIVPLFVPNFGQDVDVTLASTFEEGSAKISTNGRSAPGPNVVLIDAFLRSAGSETPADLPPTCLVPNGAALLFAAIKYRSEFIGLAVPPVRDQPWLRLYDIALGDNSLVFTGGSSQVKVNIQAVTEKFDPVTQKLIQHSAVPTFISEHGSQRLVDVIDWAHVFCATTFKL